MNNNTEWGKKRDVFACIDTDWCAVARCDHDCRETSDGSSFICTCRDGYVLNDDGLTCRRECADCSLSLALMFVLSGCYVGLG